MKFLLDHDVWAATARFLRELGHDVIVVSAIGLAQADDSDLLKTAHERNRIFVTRDRDFGNLVFAKDIDAGIIYLRILPSTQNSVHAELARMLKEHSEDELQRAFVVVEPGRHRIRKLDLE